MNNRKIILLLIAASVALFSCVSTKRYRGLENDYNTLQQKFQSNADQCESDKKALADNLNKLRSGNGSFKEENASLNKQISFYKENHTQALQQLENLSVVSKQQAESIRRSMENIGVKDAYIQTLQQQMAYKDSLNMALVMNLKGAIGNLDDQDINTKVDKGVVYIDISDKPLFKSGSYQVTEKAKGVLAKVAKVLNNQPDLEFMVEGHTDNVPYQQGVLLDNWDLSVKRSTAIVRLLQKEYGMDPKKISAAGRGEYNPIQTNDSADGRAANRRTRIVILPQLDQFFKLLERK